MAPLLHLDLKSHSLAVMRSASDICSFDRAGRLVSYFDGQAHHWRGLSGMVVRKWTDSAGRKQVQVLSRDEGLKVLDRARSLLQDLPAGNAEVREIVARALAYDPIADEAAFRRVYGRVGILPPDQYLALVLQVATGCAWNRCTFCHFYTDQPFHRRSVREFQEHITAVLEFLGPSLLLRKSIFLGDADVFTAPPETLAGMVRIARERVGLSDVYAFAEAASVRRRQPAEISGLAFRRLYLGAESGSDEALAFYRKRSRCADLIAAVETLREAGTPLGLIFLAGLGRPEHVPATLELVRSLPLRPGDIVYLSRLWGAAEEIAESEMECLREGLAFLKPLGVKVAPYDIRQFVY